MAISATTSLIAETTFKKGFNCAQSVLSAYVDTVHLPRETAFKIATGFGAGMGRKQEVCGAVSGAIMVLGLLYGRGQDDDRAKTERTYQFVRQFIDAFEAVHGTIICHELLSGCCLATEEERKIFRENGLIEKCYKYVKTACRILDTLMGEVEVTG